MVPVPAISIPIDIVAQHYNAAIGAVNPSIRHGFGVTVFNLESTLYVTFQPDSVIVLMY